jgi:hypothetical protein
MFLAISALLVILFEFVFGTVDVSLFLLGHLRCVSPPAVASLSSGLFVNIFK